MTRLITKFKCLKPNDRTCHCKEKLEAFVNGEISSISKLEEPLLDFLGGGNIPSRRPICFNDCKRQTYRRIKIPVVDSTAGKEDC